mmetsp:Transcript_11725/g.31842  ORF Transcript_11725/g.31842 Transcript_11725/m.31842 type:complete len:231 (+) Transcript_11725:1681-2373(+)
MRDSGKQSIVCSAAAAARRRSPQGGQASEETRADRADGAAVGRPRILGGSPAPGDRWRRLLLLLLLNPRIIPLEVCQPRHQSGIGIGRWCFRCPIAGGRCCVGTLFAAQVSYALQQRGSTTAPAASSCLNTSRPPVIALRSRGPMPAATSRSCGCSSDGSGSSKLFWRRRCKRTIRVEIGEGGCCCFSTSCCRNVAVKTHEVLQGMQENRSVLWLRQLWQPSSDEEAGLA